MMPNYADIFLDQNENIDTKNIKKKEIKGKPVDYADMLLSMDAGPMDQFIGDKPLGSVLTKEFMGKGGIPASLIEHIKAGAVDDPVTKIKIYAAGRFPNLTEEERLKRYGYHKGEIVYMGDNGKLYRETPNTFIQKMKRFAGETIANAPALILSAVLAGLTEGGSLIGAAVGAAGGEGIRKVTGALAFNEPQTATGNIASMGKEALMAGAGEKFSSIGVRGLNWIGAKRGGKLAALAGPLRGDINIAKTAKIRNIGKQYGIDLSAAETTGSRRLVNEYNLLGDLEPTADIIQADRLKRMSQIEGATKKLFKKISPRETTLTKTSNKLIDISKKIIEKPVKIRRAKAAPLYKKAFEENPPVNVNKVVAFIDDELKTAKGEIRTHLLKAKKTLMKPDLPNAKGSLDTSLKGLHGAKMDLDRAIEQAKKDGLGNSIRHNYKKIRDLLVFQMDKASPAYKAARSIYSSYSKEVEKQSVKTILGDITKLKGDKKIIAIRRLFASPDSHPEVLSKIAKQLNQEDPKILRDAVRHYFQDEFAKISDLATDDITNIGGMFQKKIFGTKLKKEKIKAITDKKTYQAIENLMEVFKRTGLIMRKESATATRQESLKRAEGIAGRLIRAKTRPLYTYERIIGDFFRSTNTNRNLKRLANSLVSEDAIKQLEKMIQLPKMSQKLIPQIGTFLALVAKGKYESDKMRTNRKNVLPPEMRLSISKQKMQK